MHEGQGRPLIKHTNKEQILRENLIMDKQKENITT